MVREDQGTSPDKFRRPKKPKKKSLGEGEGSSGVEFSPENSDFPAWFSSKLVLLIPLPNPQILTTSQSLGKAEVVSYPGQGLGLNSHFQGAGFI